MVNQSIEEAPIQPVSRFSTSTSLMMSSASQSSRPVVPMPRWSNAIGCARAVIAILALAFTAASTGIWCGFPAFGIALFTSSATLIIFAYYFVALSRKPALYNRWAILALEVGGTLFWLVSFALLSRWTSFYSRFWYGRGPSYGFWHAPFRPSDMGLSPRTIVKRASSSRRAGVALAGTAAGLGGIEFVLFCITLTVFGLALHRQRVAESNRTGAASAPASAPMSAAAPAIEEEKAEETTLEKPQPVVV
ncbi:hypothetical protein Z517_05505 [Fonsecaea pedrosoi CBS 271.37]|uniref:MARVEL domain-containing protein n=1 Tax=Fonsecaea pedrosoi CBS 271.37 TaxID=1442368 RepID=A0A0D2GNG6_9EURO|nr:uncharacterized protein Z517_05505 [Fonsecaea pedrosoi CBS 271.37]KIW82478.1 hypothetical protein Z517_05505 [Fonsecaea pedrosoi CBS 271.37]